MAVCIARLPGNSWIIWHENWKKKPFSRKKNAILNTFLMYVAGGAVWRACLLLQTHGSRRGCGWGVQDEPDAGRGETYLGPERWVLINCVTYSSFSFRLKKQSLSLHKSRCIPLVDNNYYLKWKIWRNVFVGSGGDMQLVHENSNRGNSCSTYSRDNNIQDTYNTESS